MESSSTATSLKKTQTGVVVSTKMQKTVVVSVVRKVRHAKYRKFVTSRKRFLVHDENQECRLGDEVEIVEVRPLSCKKRWRLGAIKSRAEGVRPSEA